MFLRIQKGWFGIQQKMTVYTIINKQAGKRVKSTASIRRLWKQPKNPYFLTIYSELAFFVYKDSIIRGRFVMSIGFCSFKSNGLIE